MSTTDVRTTVDAIHMRVVYFDVTEADGTERELRVRSPTAADVSRVFQQLDLLLDYAPLVTAPPGLNVMRGVGSGGAPPGRGKTSHRAPEAIKQTLAKINQKISEQQSEQRRELQELFRQDLEAHFLEPVFGTDPQEVIERATQAFAKEISSQLKLEFSYPSDKPLSATAHSLAELRSQLASLSPRRPRGSVLSLRMDSPLEIVLEIPLVAWPGIAIGLLALSERIATMPVRIARKRKEEMLQSAILDKQTQLVNDGRADVLAELLLQQGPDRQVRGPDDITFLDPEDPSDELEAVAVQR